VLEDEHSGCVEAFAKKAAVDAASAATVSPNSPNTPNVLQAMVQLEQAKTRAKAANKVALDAEKEKDAAEQEVQRLQLQAMRARTHAATAHDDEDGEKRARKHAVTAHDDEDRPLLHEKVQLLVQGMFIGARAWAWLCVTW
jgi:hypothetical protein